ncbi:hypothetical protein B566_EDAN003541 [Ephemera danica]|nr:hypothetical protein B566_EDAN003541 [Ephemera danica]
MTVELQCQVSELQHKLEMKEEVCRANAHVEILSQLGLECTDLTQAGEHIQLEAFKKLKRSANGQHVSSTAHSKGSTGDNSVPTLASTAPIMASSPSSFSSPRSTTSASDTQDAEECNNMLSELADIIAIKQDQLQATKDDNFKPDEAFTDPPSSGESSEVEKFHKSFEVYHARVAVSQRDAVIGQLKDSLQTALAHKERLSMDEKLKQDLAVLTRDQAIPEDVIESMELKFQQLAQKQVLLAVARVKEEQEASFVRQLSSQTIVYREELAVITAKLQHQKQMDLLTVRQELAELKRTHTESAQQPNASELVASLMKQDKEVHNRNILDHLTRTTQHQFTSAISSLARRWSTRCQEMVNQLTKQLETCSDLTKAEDLVKVKVQLLEGVSQLRLGLAQAHTREVDNLREELTKSHSALESTAAQNDENEALSQQVAMLREALLEQHRELERLRIVIAEFEKNTRGIDDIMKLKDEKHKLEMDDLRTYFQQKCADLEKEYTEKVISQHSRNSSSCSEGELHSTEMTCADSEHSSRLVNITRRCETFSDNSSLRDSDGHNTSDLEHRLVSQEVEMERVRSETVHHYEAEIARLKLQHENHIRDLARDLQSGSEQELRALTEGHRNEVQRLQSVHEEVIRNLEKSHLDVVEQLRVELYKAQSSGSQETKEMENERFEAAVNEKVREHTQVLATEVDKMTTAIKEDAEREQASLLDAHQQTLVTLVAQHQAQLETMRTRLAANNADVVAQLRALHDDELQKAEERYRRNMETQAVFIRDEAVREHQRKSAVLMEELAAAHRSELAARESRLTEAHQQEVTRVRSSLEAKVRTVCSNS